MIHYSKSGNGHTIVLIHGFCENSTCFSEQVFFLQQYFCVITPDLPGFGKSQPTENTSMESMADSVHAVLQHEHVESCIMLGHSMGGYVTLAFARKYPHLLKGFGLLHSTALPDTDERKQKRDQAIKLIGEKGPEIYVRNFIPPLFSKHFNNTETIDQLIEEGLRSPAAGLIQALLAMKAREDHTQLLEETRLPVFFTIGGEDTIIPEDNMFQQASSCHMADICYLEKAAHMGFIEYAEKVSAAIKGFATDLF